MTLSISAERRERARQPRSDDSPNRSKHLLRSIQIFTIATALIGVAGLTVAFCLEDWRAAVAGGTSVVLAAFGGFVWCLHGMLADRREFYRRGHVEGWYRGWNGQEPNADDPLIRS